MNKYEITAGLNYLTENPNPGDFNQAVASPIGSINRDNEERVADANVTGKNPYVVSEKWSGDTEIKSTGKWADKTIAELKKARSALKDKEDRTKEETSKLRQINFAIRSKKDWKGGVDEGDGSGSYGGQSPLTYEDDELNEITKLSGLGEAKRKERTDVEDDWDDEDAEDEKPEDPEKDKIPHILMQLKKAQDVDGDYPIKFQDGTKHIVSVNNIDTFIEMYMSLRPLDREKLQQVAIMSKEQFDKVLSFFQPKHPLHHKSIYEK
jgi:hypothetical protein